jgi:hypothetical protein
MKYRLLKIDREDWFLFLFCENSGSDDDRLPIPELITFGISIMAGFNPIIVQALITRFLKYHSIQL